MNRTSELNQITALVTAYIWAFTACVCLLNAIHSQLEMCLSYGFELNVCSGGWTDMETFINAQNKRKETYKDFLAPCSIPCSQFVLGPEAFLSCGLYIHVL